MLITCIRCGKQFEVARVYGRMKYCSDDCRFGYATFMTKVKKTDSCWLWMAGLNVAGYGSLPYASPGERTAHRESYRFHKGPIPEGMHVCHTCDNRRCVNPDHLFLGTHKDNMKDMREKRRYKLPKPEQKARGEKVGASKLTGEKVSLIRSLAASGVKHGVIAAQFDISDCTVCNIVNRVYWKHVP